MIDSFNCDDSAHQLGIVVVNVFDQFGLCVGGPYNEDCTSVGD
jgi:hypothetical protein